MSTINFTKFYKPADFTSLGAGSVNLAVLSVAYSAAMPTLAPDAIELISTNSVRVTWSGIPVASELTAADAVVAAHTGTVTSSAPIQLSNLAVVPATTATLVTVIDFTTPALTAGTYLVTVASQLNMLAVVAATFVQAIFTVTIGAGAAIQVAQTNVASQTQVASFDPSAMLAVTAGQTLRVQLQVAKVGATAATAQAQATRMSIAKVA